MRLILTGSGAFGLPTFQYLHHRHEIAAVITQPDREAGRNRKLTATPVAEWSQGAGVTTIKVENINTPQSIRQIAGLEADAAVVIAFGQKLFEETIAAMGKLCVNLHASLLPKYRGAAPINWAIINGETQTGLTVIGLAQKMDAGDIYAQSRTAIDPHETAGELHDRLAAMGPALLDEVLSRLHAGTLRPKSQDHQEATSAPKLSKADATVNLDATTRAVRCRVHGLTPWPGVRVQWVRRETSAVQPLILLRVAEEPDMMCDVQPGTILDGGCVAVRDGVIRLLEVQLPGGKPMMIDQFMRGHEFVAGDRLVSG